MAINKNIAACITAAFVKGLEQGRIPWQRGWNEKNSPWEGKHYSRSLSLSTGKPYHGLNAMLVDSFPLDVPIWATYNHWKKIGAPITEGESGTPITNWSVSFKNANGKYLTTVEYSALDGESQKKCSKNWTLSYYTVFHIGQVVECAEKTALLEKWASKFSPSTPEKPEEAIFRHDEVEKIASRWDVEVKHVEGNRACYYPTLDKIQMPLMAQFISPEEYYGTLMHEACHASGAEKRLKRSGVVDGTYFGSDKYSYEELIAEIGSAMVCSHLNIDIAIENKIAYVNGWAKQLKSNPEWIIKAATEAVKAAGWVLDWLDGEKVQNEAEGE